MPRRIQYEVLHTKAVMNKVNVPSMPFEWSINPYRGCLHGCSFCYARATHTFLGMEADDTFQNHILLKSNAAEALEEQLAKLARSRRGQKPVGRIAIGTATDPYQPVEAKAKITRQCLEVLARYQIPLSITTRSPLILRDIDLLKKLPVTAVNFSINTLDLNVWRNMEPSSPAPRQRLKAMRTLRQSGIPSGVFLAPVLPLLTDLPEQLEAVIKAAAEHQALFVMPSFLRFNRNEVKVWFFRNLQRVYPNLTRRYGELYQNSPVLPASYREPVMNRIRMLLKKYRLDESVPSIRTSEPVMREDGAEAGKTHVQLSFNI